MSEYQIQVIEQAWILLLFYPWVSAYYYLNTKSLLQSAHGVIALAGFGYAVVACEYTQFDPPDYWYWPIYICFIGSNASMVYSFKAFSSRKHKHTIHAVTFSFNLLTTFIAIMAVAHDWV